ncbi:hypothetical protein BJ170DRAFT_594150 [Xylariales sp. AK1849]|nr:hypothetical protein BJ170DRAFT_594150 [Xylariales sp. AK1849]
MGKTCVCTIPGAEGAEPGQELEQYASISSRLLIRCLFRPYLRPKDCKVWVALPLPRQVPPCTPLLPPRTCATNRQQHLHLTTHHSPSIGRIAALDLANRDVGIGRQAHTSKPRNLQICSLASPACYASQSSLQVELLRASLTSAVRNRKRTTQPITLGTPLLDRAAAQTLPRGVLRKDILGMRAATLRTRGKDNLRLSEWFRWCANVSARYLRGRASGVPRISFEMHSGKVEFVRRGDEDVDVMPSRTWA